MSSRTNRAARTDNLTTHSSAGLRPGVRIAVFVFNSTADANGNVTLTDPLSRNPPDPFYRAALP